MRILHTADWHLGARLGRVDRADDLRRAVEQVFRHCEREAVDVLLIAGDLFDSVCRTDDVCAAVGHMKDVARPFLRSGGTILALTGNHDGETFCKTLQHTLTLADPEEADFGGLWTAGRFHLATRPTFCRLADRSGHEVQFVLMPYPTPERYLDDALPRHETRDRLLLNGFRDTLARMRAHSRFRPDLHSVLAAHLYLAGVTLPSGHVVGEGDGVVCPAEDLGAGWAYVALGHVHKPQTLAGCEHVRYCGSIDRLRMDERHDAKGVVLVEVGPDGMRGEVVTLPLEATPFLDLVHRPARRGAARAARHTPTPRGPWSGAGWRTPPASTTTTPSSPSCGRSSRGATTSRWRTSSSRRPQASASADGPPRREFREIVIDYLTDQLGEGHDDAEAVLAAAETLIEETRA